MEQKRQIYSDEDIPDIVRGHEVWIEYDGHSIPHGEGVECKLCFGHNMKSERAVEIEKVKSIVFDTRGKEYDSYVGSGGDHLLVRFTPEHEGYHTLGVEYNGGILNLPHPGLEGAKYYQQYTKTIIPVGRPREEYDLTLGHELEIVPMDYRQYNAGDDIILKILYDGRALAGATVYAIYVGNEDCPIEVQTDNYGRAAVKLEADGKWMFKVMHRDPEKSAQDRYDEKVMTATFTVMDVR
ncbi:MAG: DUF4198 domain-containing protein [Candidatus Methanogasteraceae archaeon]